MLFGDSAILIKQNSDPTTLPPSTPYIGLEHIAQEQLRLNGCGLCSDVSSTKQQFSSGDILFGKLRPYFRKVASPRFDGICSTDIWVIRATEKIEPKFLFYWCATWDFVNHVNVASEGTRMPRAKWEVAANHEISDFSLPEQKAIAQILGTLDEKIELNQKMNHTLEEISKAIFKSWFVDFDPVRAKAEGRPTGLPPEISDLFPDELVESEIGEIPKEWDVGPISDFGQVICGKTPSTKNPLNFNGVFPFITIPDMHNGLVNIETNRTISDEGAKSLKGKLLPSGAVCVSCIATPGLVTMTTKESFTNQQINSIISDNEKTREYLLFSMIRMGELIRVEGSGGSVFTNLNTGRFKRLPILIPQAEVLSAYSNICRAILDRMLIALEESKTLSKLRDTLLPKLISGQLRIPDAEKFLEEAGV